MLVNDLCIDSEKQQHLPTVHDSERIVDYIGLKNYINTCYISAIIQVLFHTNGLIEALTNHDFIQLCKSQIDALDFVLAFINLMSSLSSCSATQTNENMIYLYSFILLKRDTQQRPFYQQHQQHDAAEFFSHLLRWICVPIAEIAELAPLMANASFQSALPCNDYLKRQFLIFTIDSITCTQGHVSVSKGSTPQLLQLTVNSDNYTDLNKCISDHFQPEDLESCRCSVQRHGKYSNCNAYRCASCNGAHVKATKQSRISNASEHLAIQLKLFQFNGIKVIISI